MRFAAIRRSSPNGTRQESWAIRSLACSSDLAGDFGRPLERRENLVCFSRREAEDAAGDSSRLILLNQMRVCARTEHRYGQLAAAAGLTELPEVGDAVFQGAIPTVRMRHPLVGILDHPFH